MQGNNKQKLVRARAENFGFKMILAGGYRMRVRVASSGEFRRSEAAK